MRFVSIFSLGILIISSGFVYAQGAAVEGVESFKQAEGAWRRAAENGNSATAAKGIVPLEKFYEDNGKIAVQNIVNAEQVFCYEVFSQNPDYEGYSVNGFPIRGFCGVLNNQIRDMIGEYFLATPTNIDFDRAENCMIQPKVMIRFIRGIDSTDVLISSPCHSFAIFYGGNVSVYNFRPGAEIADAMVSALSEKHAEFVSPALLNQLLPIGVVQNEQQRKIVNRRSEPVREWQKKVEAEEAKQAEERKKNQTGWNKLKIKSFGQK
jgi:hypothetical protein